jgi:signal transduction histidine kinase/ligand-binding sensor domain-containing protein/DNA-binding response OmpR family regulator
MKLFQRLLWGGIVVVLLSWMIYFVFWRENPLQDVSQIESPRFLKHKIATTPFPYTYIYSIAQDKDGFLWVGSVDGLLKYDGYQYDTYKTDYQNPKSFQGRKIRNLFIDSQGIVWVATMSEGLHRFDPQTQSFQQYIHQPTNKKSLPENYVIGLWEDAKKNIWLATANGYIAKVIQNKQAGKDSISFETYLHKATNVHFVSFAKSKNNTIWIGTSWGLLKFDMNDPGKMYGEGKFQIFTLNHHEVTNFSHNFVSSVLVEKKSKNQELLWIGTSAGLKKLEFSAHVDTPQITHYQYEEGQDIKHENMIRAIYQTRLDPDYIWVGAEKGIYRFHKGSQHFVPFRFHHTAKENTKVISFFEDESGVLWMGTVKGIEKYDPYKKIFTHINNENPPYLAGADIKCLYQDQQAIWLGTSRGRLNQLEFNQNSLIPDKINTFEFSGRTQKTFLNDVQTLCLQKPNLMWVGTNGNGLLRFKIPQNIQAQNIIKDYDHFEDGLEEGKLKHNFVFALLNDSKNNIWVGTYSGGLSRYDSLKNQFFTYNQVKGLKDNLTAFPIVKLLEDSFGSIWIGTRGGGIIQFYPNGLAKAGKETFTAYQVDKTSRNSLPDNYITDIVEDDKQNLWIGTESGLCYFDKANKQFLSFSQYQELPEEAIQSIQQDKDNPAILWVSTKTAVVKMDTKLLNMPESKHLLFRKYNIDDVEFGSFNNNASCINQQGGVFFGALNGLIAFNPQMIQNNPHSPKIALTDFQLNHQSIPVGKLEDGRVILTKDINQTDQIILKHSDNIISFEFAALHFSSPEKNRYAYKMEGFDKDWIYTEAHQRNIYYTNLPYGEYILRVRASNSDGAWSIESKTLKIKILPPFWQTIPAYILYAVMILLILYFIRFITLMRANLRHEIQIEQLKHEKTEEIHHLELQFFTNVSHEIRTPLTLILGPLENLLNTQGLTARVYHQLQTMQHNGKRLLHLLNQLLDFRKQNGSATKLQAVEGNFIEFLQEIHISFRLLAEQKNIKYIFKTEYENLPLWYDRDMLEKIFYNLLSNAFKYTPIEGHIKVSIDTISHSQILTDIPSMQSQYQEIFEQDYVKISVEDSGRGISEEDLPHIFERFYRSLKNNLEMGTGIGLSLTKDLVVVHKGVIGVSSKEAEGTSFFVYLPLGNQHLKENEMSKNFKSENYEMPAIAETLVVEEAKMNGEGIAGFMDIHHTEEQANEEQPIILIVEDNPEVLDFMKSGLLSEYQIEEASNGAEGLQKAKELIPDVIISDVMMPVMDGLMLCAKLKKDPQTSHIPVILLTARSSLLFKVQGLEMGADEYITKPFQPLYLKTRIKNLINQRKMLKKNFSNKIYVKPKEITINNADEEFLQKVIDLVDKHMANYEYNVNHLCKDLGMSRSQLYRKFKAITDQSGNEFIRTQRIIRGSQLLEQSKMTIAEVTYAVGFNDVRYFRTRFAEHFGMSPSEYVSKFRKA